MKLNEQLFGKREIETKNKYSHIYKAVRSAEFGLSVENVFITGLELIVVSKGNWYDSLEENISNIGNEFICRLPKEGLIEGAYYESYEVCTATDWETSYCDETEVYIKRVL